MVSRAFKLRFRRRLRLRKRQVEELGGLAEQQLEKNFFRRLERLVDVRRFVISWFVLLGLLAGILVVQIRDLGGYYQTPQPVPGGTYTEGILGSFTNANPIYAVSPVDSAVSHLVFAGLFKYDDKNHLVGDLARDMTMDESGHKYTVKLRPSLTWHDGKPLTADDVVFTYKTIQSPDAQSPLNSGWQGIEIDKVDPWTVRFTLPNELSSFPYSLTTGIIPMHILKDVSVESLRTANFNTHKPIGAGPFAWNALEVQGGTPQDRQEHIELKPFANYHAGKPKLDRFVVRSFRDHDALVASFKKQEVSAMVGLNQLPADLHKTAVRTYSIPLTAAVMSFFRTSEGVLADATVRQALVRATDTMSILESLDYPTQLVREPFLQGQVGYNPAFVQPSFNKATANALLESAGWHKGENGIRRKGKSVLNFRLYAQNGGDYAHVARQLVKQWRAVGVDVELVLQNNADFQSTLTYHSYDALLYGISIGTDPDVFAYWDSSQADVRSAQRLNFSEYKSSTADASLQAGRSRSDATLRSIKYQPFLQAWQKDAPAVGLYQPRFLYVTRMKVYGLDEHPINSDTDRYTNVHNWMIRQLGVSEPK